MNFGFFPARKRLRRITKNIDERFKIVDYGFNNLYPQEMKQIMLRSPLVKASINVLADFINGDGFEKNDELPINDRGQNINDILNFASHDLSIFGGFALILSMNGLGTVQEIENLPFEFVRFGLPDELGRHTEVKVSNNWEKFSKELPQGSILQPLSFPLFNANTNPENAIRGNAVVLYYTGPKNPDEYPLCTFDAITNTAESDTKIQRFELNSISNGFHGLTLFRYPGQFESDTEKEELYAKIEEMTGEAGNGIFVIETDDDTPPILENVPANNTDTLYLNTINHIRDTITQNYAMPGVLLGISASGSVFNEQALIDSYIIYNARTKNQRDQVGRIFNLIGDFGEIIAQTITPVEEVTPEVVETPEVVTLPPEEEEQNQASA